MGVTEDLEAERKGPESQVSKIDAWLASLPEKDRKNFVAALMAPQEIFPHLALVRVANNNGCDVKESTLRRFRKKLQENS